MKLVLVVLIAITSVVAHAATPRVPVDELRRLQLGDPTLVLIDVRDAKAFAQGHIQGARNIPAPDILSATFPHGGPIVVYCGEDPCPLTTSAAEKLISYGHKDVSILGGGFGDWLAKGYPAEKALKARAAPQGRSARTDETRRKIEEGQAIVLDLRTAAQFAAGHLPKARSVPLEELNEAMAWLAKDREIVAVIKLAAAGFKVEELSGGVAAWVKKGLPLEIK